MTNSNPPSSPQDTPIKDRIMIFMGDNLHVVLEDEGDQSVISTERFAQDLANQLNQLITRSKLELLDRLEQFKEDVLESRGIDNPTYIGKKELQEFIDNAKANLKESLNE